MPDDNSESRFTRLEHDVARLREDVASSRVLAALADRDVAELRTEMRAHHQVLNALRETQLAGPERDGSGTTLPGRRALVASGRPSAGGTVTLS